MRSFAFSSIQDQRAELERGGQRRGGAVCCSSKSPPSMLHSFRQAGTAALTLTDRHTAMLRLFHLLHRVLLPSSSLQPHLVWVLFGLLLSLLGFWVCLVFIWFGFIFGILFKKKKKKQKQQKTCDTCSLLTTACPSIPFFVVVKDQSRINKETPPSRVGFLGRAGWRGLQQRGVGASSSVTLLFSAPPAPLISTSVSVLCSCVLAAALIEKPSLEKMLWFPFEN